jgi:signal transduction histidine kinase
MITMQEDYSLDNYFDVIFSIYNPVYLSIFIFLVIVLLLFISYKYVYNPLLKKHKKEKESLELKSARLLALFSELDPNPIIRIDRSGMVVGLNQSAANTFNMNNSKGYNIQNILRGFILDIDDLILKNKSTVLTQEINGKFYEINSHGISLLDSAQLYFYDLTEKKNYEVQMTTYQRLLRESSAHLNSVIEQERNRYAGLLHDSIGQSLLLIKLSLQNARKNFSNQFISNTFEDIDILLDKTINEVKEMTHNIRPLNLNELGLRTVITSLCKTVSKESGIISQLKLPGEDPNLPKDLELCIYRVLQEALNNIIKHSKAKEFIVNLEIDNESVTLIISDDGIGFKPILLLNEKYVSDGMGIINMQERVERLNGSFHIDSSHNNGTVITIDFPITSIIEEDEYDYKNASS